MPIANVYIIWILEEEKRGLKMYLELKTFQT